MTLFKQISILVIFLYFILVSIIVINDFKQASVVMQGQLKTTAQDMSTTLGIAISNHPLGDEVSTLEVLFNSVFDSGYYSKIQLVSMEGSVIHEKKQELSIQGVPNWFLSIVTLEEATGTTQVIKGWSQLGYLHLTMHPGFAYSGLYKTLVSTLQWFGVFFAVSILTLWLLLHFLLKPLKRVKSQADAIHNNQFVIQDEIPSTLELKSVVVAMNRMIGKIQSVFTEQEKALDEYRDLLYVDQFTGLGNRRFMLEAIRESMVEGCSFHGCFALIKLVDFDGLQEKKGFDTSDKIIKMIAQQIESEHQGLMAEKVARIGNDEFALLIASGDELAKDFMSEIFEKFQQQTKETGLIDSFYLIAGVSALDIKGNVGDLLSNVDYCLTVANNKGPYTVEKSIATEFELPHGKMQWRSWLDDAVKTEKLFLVGQKVIDLNNNVVQKEMFVRMKNENGEVIPASAFMPMASVLGLSFDIDKSVLSIANNLTKEGVTEPIALNLSKAFFNLTSAMNVLEELLTKAKESGKRLCFESSHHVLQQNLETCHEISEKVRRYGHQFGLDNLDFSQSLRILQSTKFDYVKIYARTLCEMNAESTSSAFSALKTLTDTLDIDIIAVGVDSQELYDDVRKLGIKFLQGNFLFKAEEQKNND